MRPECGAPAGAAAGARSSDRSPAARNIRKNRVMENKNMLFGLRPIIEAIEAGRQIEKVYLKKGADGVLLGELAELCRQRRIRVQWVPVAEKLNQARAGQPSGRRSADGVHRVRRPARAARIDSRGRNAPARRAGRRDRRAPTSARSPAAPSAQEPTDSSRRSRARPR